MACMAMTQVHVWVRMQVSVQVQVQVHVTEQDTMAVQITQSMQKCSLTR